MNAWVVDSCVVLDVACHDARFGLSSARFLQSKLADKLLIAPVTFVELAPQFAGQMSELKSFLQLAGIGWQEPWTIADTETAFNGWARYIELKRLGRAKKRPVADLLIGAFASRFDGLITRNPDDFRPFFPNLKLLSP